MRALRAHQRHDRGRRHRPRRARPALLAPPAHRGLPGLQPLRAAAAGQRRTARRPDEVVEAALTDAGAADLADLDTVLAPGYDGGRDLSGGQWQRVAVARALCAVRQGAGVVVLDEPTAQLDVRGEAEIFDRILTATKGCTTVLISHRFSTVQHADRICVLADGRVAELGTHDELMAANGRYRQMFDLQASRFEEEPDGIAG
ncbi:ATP-binding cassette domain-containing protein [Kitasatospora aburaviensis]